MINQQDPEFEKIRLNSMWFWNSSKIGRGIKHTVISIEEDEIISWSDYQCEKENQGYSFIGTPEQFIKSFKFIGFQK